MVSSQIADAEGNDRYFVMSTTVRGVTSWSVYDRQTGGPVKTGFMTKHGAAKRADQLNGK